jgi:alpha-mannosidase
MNDSEQSFGSSMLTAIDSHAERLCQRLRSLSQIDILTDWRMYLGNRSSAEINTDTNKWNPISLNEKGQISWGRGRQEIWLAQKLVIPTHLQGYPVTSLACRPEHRLMCDCGWLVLGMILVH